MVGEITRVRKVLFKDSHHSMIADCHSKQALEIKPTMVQSLLLVTACFTQHGSHTEAANAGLSGEGRPFCLTAALTASTKNGLDKR